MDKITNNINRRTQDGDRYTINSDTPLPATYEDFRTSFLGSNLTIVNNPSTIFAIGTPVDAVYLNDMQKNGLFKTTGTRIAGTPEVYTLDIGNIDDFWNNVTGQPFDIKLFFKANATNTAINPAIRIGGIDYQIEKNGTPLGIGELDQNTSYIIIINTATGKADIADLAANKLESGGSTLTGKDLENRVGNKYTFDTIADLQAVTFLQIGDIVETLGKTIKNDGFFARYKISNVDNGGLTLQNGLFADYIVNRNSIDTPDGLVVFINQEDLHDLPDTKVYYAINCINRPAEGEINGYVRQYKISSTFKHLVYTGLTTGISFQKFQNNGIWSDWDKIITEKEFNQTLEFKNLLTSDMARDGGDLTINGGNSLTGARKTISILGDSISHGYDSTEAYSDGYAYILQRLCMKNYDSKSEGYINTFVNSLNHMYDVNFASWVVKTAHTGSGATIALDEGSKSPSGTTAIGTSASGNLTYTIKGVFGKKIRIWYTKMPSGGTANILVNGSVVGTINSSNASVEEFSFQDFTLEINPTTGLSVVEIDVTSGSFYFNGLNQLNEATDEHVNVFAQSGRVIWSLSDNLIDDICKSEVVIFALGHNDNSSYQTLQSYRDVVDAKLELFVSYCNSYNTRFVLIDFIWGETASSSLLRSKLFDVCSRINKNIYLPFPDNFTGDGSTLSTTEMINGNPNSYNLLLDDVSHPNDKLHELISTTISNSLNFQYITKKESFRINLWRALPITSNPYFLQPFANIENCNAYNVTNDGKVRLRFYNNAIGGNGYTAKTPIGLSDNFSHGKLGYKIRFDRDDKVLSFIENGTTSEFRGSLRFTSTQQSISFYPFETKTLTNTSQFVFEIELDNIN